MDSQYLTNCRKLDRKMGVGPDGEGPWEEKLRDYGNPVLRLICDHCGNMSEHVSDLALLISEEQAIEYCRYYDNHHLEVVKGFFLNSIYKEWGMIYHQASARFLLDRIPPIDRRTRTM